MYTDPVEAAWLMSFIVGMEQKGLVTRTFRRLDPSRQEAVVRAILEVSAEDGPTELSVPKVAEKANVAVGSLYQYFSGKEGMLQFAISLSMATLMALLEQGRPYLLQMPLREALIGFMNGGVEWGQAQIGATRFFCRAAYQGDAALTETVVRPIAEAMRKIVEEILQAAESRGELRPGVDIPATARILYAITITATDPLLLPYLNVYFQLYNAEMPSEKITSALLDLIMKGVEKPAG
jgi:AcrR family transcriptional regulator